MGLRTTLLQKNLEKQAILRAILFTSHSPSLMIDIVRTLLRENVDVRKCFDGDDGRIKGDLWRIKE
jgi:hypothetical protein